MDGGAIIWALKQNGIEIVTPSQTYKQESENAFMMYVEFGMAQKVIDDLSRNVKRGLKQKAEKGWLPSGAKPGYMNDKYAEKGNKTVKKDPKRFPLIRKAWDLMLTGAYTPPQILEKLNNEWGYRTPKHRRIGGKPMSRSMIYKIFTDPFYYGEFEYPEGSGNWFKGKHEPTITKEEFDRVQMLLGRKGSPRSRTKEFPYTGTMRCGECGAMITAEERWQIIFPECKTKFHKGKLTIKCLNCSISIENMVNPTLLHYIYYHCTKSKNPNCTQGSIQAKDLEKQIDSLLSKIQISEKFRDWAVKYLNELNEEEVEDRNAVLTSLEEAYDDVVKRIDNLVRLKISPQNTDGNLLSDEEFKSQKEALIREKASLEEKLNDTGNRISKWIELSEKTFDFACHARYWFANGDMTTKRQIFQSLGSNLTLKDKIVRIELAKPLEWIEETKDEVVEIRPEFEPEEKFENMLQLEAYYSQNPTLLLG